MPSGWRCQPPSAYSFTNAAVATYCSSRSPAIAACSARTDRCHVRRFRVGRSIAALRSEETSRRVCVSQAMSRSEMKTSDSRTSVGDVASDSAGVLGAIVAALCCAGTPLIVSALAALGLSALRRDAILWPVMLGSLLLALWGFWRGFRMHRTAGPLALGILPPSGTSQYGMHRAPFRTRRTSSWATKISARLTNQKALIYCLS